MARSNLTMTQLVQAGIPFEFDGRVARVTARGPAGGMRGGMGVSGLTAMLNGEIATLNLQFKELKALIKDQESELILEIAYNGVSEASSNILNALSEIRKTLKKGL